MNAKFNILKFSLLTKRNQKELAEFLDVSPSFMSMVTSNKRKLSISQILKLQQIDEGAWEQCIEKELADQLSNTKLDIAAWNALTGGIPTKIELQKQENEYVKQLKEKDNEIEKYKVQIIVLQNEIKFKDEMIDRLLKIIDKRIDK